MKTIGKKSTVLLLVLAILGTCFMSFGWSKREKALALASDIDTIYYLTDYYPTLSYDALYYEFGDSYEYQYELKALDERSYMIWFTQASLPILRKIIW